ATRRPYRRAVFAGAEADPLGVPAGCAHQIELLRAAAVGIEDDAAGVWRIGRRRVDRIAFGQPHRLSRAQIERVDVAGAVLGAAEHDAVAFRREARREGHAGKVAERFLLAAVDVAQIDARRAAGIG